MKKSIYTLFLLICFVGATFGFASSQVFAETQEESCAQNQSYTQPNAIRVQRIIDDKITHSYILPANSAKMREIGILEDKISTFRFFLSIYVSAWANSFKDRLCEGVSLQNCVYWQEFDGVGFSLIFDDLASQQKFFGVQGQVGKVQKPNEKGLFFKKISVSTSFPIATEESAKSLQKICFFAIEDWAKEENIEDEKVQKLTDFLQNCNYIYDFSTPNRTLISDNMYFEDEVCHHFFVKNLAQIKQNPTITFWTKTTNKPVWWLSVLLVVLVGMSVAFLSIKIRQKCRKN